ncbi:MAG TPA: MFS transporter [Roseiflexaceae bacterium]|nr:MFS transporter [Roseiflexaceae bacterium]
MFVTIRQRNFALLWFAGLISLAGDWTLRVALPIYVYQLSGSTLATSAMLMAGMLPRLLFGSVAGVFVDRWDRKRTMVLANLLMAVGLLPLLAVRSADQLWLIYVVALVEATIAQFFGPAENALLPRLVPEEHLIAANSLNALNNNLARLVGPALGGVAAALVGLAGVALIDAASFLIAGLLIALISGQYTATEESQTKAPATVTSAWAKVWHEWLAGLQLIARNRTLVVIFGLEAITSLGEGVFGVLFVVFVNKILSGGAQEIGWLMSAQAIGGLLGGLLVGWLGARFTPVRLAGIGTILFGLIDLAIFNYPRFSPEFLPILALFVVVGVPGVIGMTGVNTLLQTVVADEFRGRVFGAIGMVASLMALIGLTLAGVIGDRVGVITVLNIQGAGYIVAGLMVLALLRGSARHARAAEQSSLMVDNV